MLTLLLLVGGAGRPGRHSAGPSGRTFRSGPGLHYCGLPDASGVRSLPIPQFPHLSSFYLLLCLGSSSRSSTRPIPIESKRVLINMLHDITFFWVLTFLVSTFRESTPHTPPPAWNAFDPVILARSFSLPSVICLEHILAIYRPFMAKNERSFWKFSAKFGYFLTFCPLKLMGHKKAAIPEIRLVLPMKPQAFIVPKRCVFGRSGRTPSCPPEIAHCAITTLGPKNT